MLRTVPNIEGNVVKGSNPYYYTKRRKQHAGERSDSSPIFWKNLSKGAENIPYSMF